MTIDQTLQTTLGSGDIKEEIRKRTQELRDSQGNLVGYTMLLDDENDFRYVSVLRGVCFENDKYLMRIVGISIYSREQKLSSEFLPLGNYEVRPELHPLSRRDALLSDMKERFADGLPPFLNLQMCDGKISLTLRKEGVPVFSD